MSRLPLPDQDHLAWLQADEGNRALHAALEHLRATGMDTRPLEEAAQRHAGNLEAGKELIVHFAVNSPSEALVMVDWLLEGLVDRFASPGSVAVMPDGSNLLDVMSTRYARAGPPREIHGALERARDLVLRARQRLLVWATERST